MKWWSRRGARVITLRDFIYPERLLILLGQQLHFAKPVTLPEERHCPDGGRPCPGDTDSQGPHWSKGPSWETSWMTAAVDDCGRAGRDGITATKIEPS